jgi:hypothetical protein
MTYKKCTKCQKEMTGIIKPATVKQRTIRGICEPCGGNTTDYHAGKTYREAMKLSPLETPPVAA